jgi:hypothetical protein
MKKAILLAMCLVLFGAGAAMAYTVNNTTQIGEYTVNTLDSWTNPGVSIPPNSIYTTPGANFNTSTGDFTIFTSWSLANNGTIVANSVVNTAFLFINTNPAVITGWNYAIDLTNSILYSNLTITNSQNAGGGGTHTTFGSNGSIGYGRYYGPPGSTALIPVLATGTVVADPDLDVTWGTSGSLNTVTMDLETLLSGSTTWSFLWGTGTCGNGTFTGTTDPMVPLPPSALLLGTGLLGLVGLGWRRRQS